MTPWIDVMAMHSCRMVGRRENRGMQLTGYTMFPAAQTINLGAAFVEGRNYLMLQYQDFPWFSVVARAIDVNGTVVPLENRQGNSVYLGRPRTAFCGNWRPPSFTGADIAWSTIDTGNINFYRSYQFALVKTGFDSLPLSLPGIDRAFVRGGYDEAAGCYVESGPGWDDPRTLIIIGRPSTSVDLNFRINFKSLPATCPTPMVSGGNTRTLSPVRWDELPSVGSVAKHQDLNLQFNNCSAHLAKIRYKIDPSGSSPNPGAGLLPLRAPSTAQGLAVQVLERRQSDNAWVVSALGQWRERNTSGGSHTLPMGIRYYRTGNLVGGNVNAGMTISFQYQ